MVLPELLVVYDASGSRLHSSCFHGCLERLTPSENAELNGFDGIYISYILSLCIIHIFGVHLLFPGGRLLLLELHELLHS